MRIDEITEIDADVRGRRPKSKKKCTIKRIVRKRSTVTESVAHPEDKSLMPHGSMGSLKTVKGNKEYEITTINKSKDGRKVVKVERHPEDGPDGYSPPKNYGRWLAHARNLS